jgi:hypothetical protein
MILEYLGIWEGYNRFRQPSLEAAPPLDDLGTVEVERLILEGRDASNIPASVTVDEDADIRGLDIVGSVEVWPQGKYERMNRFWKGNARETKNKPPAATRA